ncbi:MAG: hypothetical protein EXR20_08320 [Bacteroidetes bacterium]|nr:hypothetical protein [Bacteroidota bacterium]
MKKFPKFLIIILLSTFLNTISAQVSVTLNVDSRPTPQISEWVNRANLAILTVANTDRKKVGSAYKIKVKISLNGSQVLETNNGVATQTLELGVQTFLADEIIPYDAIVFNSNDFKNKVLQTGMLPAGNYEFCVSLVDLSNNIISTPNTVCRPMLITDYQMPELLMPIANQVLQLNLLPATIFRWSPISPTPQPLDGIKYILVVTEIQEGQSPSQAFNANYPLIEKEIYGIQFNWPTDVDGPSTTKKYAWSVKPLTMSGTPYQSGPNGFVKIETFTVAVDQDKSDPPPNGTLKSATSGPPGTLAVSDTIHAGDNHEFEIAVTQIAAGATAGSFTGKGEVVVNFLKVKVAVEFEDISVDSNKNLVTGKITGQFYGSPAPVYPQDWALGALAGLPWTHNVLENVMDWVEGVSGQTIDIGDVLDNVAPPVKFPLGLNFPNGDQLAITEIVFESDISEINIVAAKNTPPSWQSGDPQLIGFIAKGVEIHPSQLQAPPKRIELLEDITVGNVNNDISFTFKKPTDPVTGGCYVQWDENGFSQFGIELDAAFTRDWLKPSPDDGTSKSKANFVATVADWDEMVLTGSLEKSEITSSQEMTVMAGNISFDMSDTLNPSTLQAEEDFPASYAGDKTMLFRGFHMEELSVELPKSFETHTGGKPTIAIRDMIINDTGVTLKAIASNVLQFPNANVADLVASIDTVSVDIRSSSMYEAFIKGKIGLPISKTDSIQNPLKYKALFHNEPAASTVNDYFQLTIEPTGPINANILKGIMTLDPTSNIMAYVDKDKRKFNLSLNGKFNWNNIKLGPVNNVSMELGFQSIQLNYDSSLTTNKMNFSAGSWSFASPQKFLANFPVTIENIGFNQLTTTGNQMVHGKLNFDVVCNLTNDIGGKTKLAVELAVDKNPTGSGLGKFKPQYIGTSIEDVKIYAHLAAVSIDGTIAFRNNDPVFGDGFKGSLSATFKTPKVSITALAEFGNTSYLYSSKYRYWRVEAAANFTPGLPFLSGVAFYGFGGGAYYNMESFLQYNSTLGKNAFTFKPKKGNLGFNVQATIGTSPKVETFNADVGLNGQFSSTQGLINIGFTGDFYVGAPLLPQVKRNEAQIKGNVIADYNFPTKHFFLGVTANINSPPVTALNQSLVLDINGSTNKWFFKFGEPTETNDVSIFGMNLYEYLMFGNDVYAPVNGFTERFRNNYYSVLNNYPGIPSGGVDNNSATGRGFALGVGFEFSKVIDQNITSNYNINLDLAAGAEVDLSMMEYTGQNCANTSQRIGFNGWRARGSIGMYLNASAFVKRNSDNNTWNLANIKAGAWVDAKFPRPTFVAGAVEGNVQIGGFTTKIHTLGDCKKCGGSYHYEHSLQWTSCVHNQQHYLVNQHFNKSFTWGDDCASGDSNTSPDTGPAVAQEDAANNQQQNLIKYVRPTNSYNFPVASPIAVKYGLPLNEAFDVTEQQSTGSVNTRTFKLVNTVVLQKQNETTLVYATVSHNSNKNSLSEYLYTLKTPLDLLPNSTIEVAKAPNTPISASTPNSVLNMQAVNSVATIGVTTSKKSGPISSIGNGTAIGSKFTVYPPPTPVQPSEYDNLPPETPAVVNTLEANKNYKIIITAVLKEYKNNVWINALKADLSPVQQVVTNNFRTGPPALILASISNKKSN